MRGSPEIQTEAKAKASSVEFFGRKFDGEGCCSRDAYCTREKKCVSFCQWYWGMVKLCVVSFEDGHEAGYTFSLV